MSRVIRLCRALCNNNAKGRVQRQPSAPTAAWASRQICTEPLLRRNCTAPPPPAATECWNCKKVTGRMNHMLCADCGLLQDVNPEINYFDLLNFPKLFAVEAPELTRRFRQLQTLVHPDKFSNKSEREQYNSAEWSSLINKAYKTLATPVERGQYMLCLNGEQVPRDNSALDKEFLMEMMERNEQVEEAESASELHKLNERIVAELQLKVQQLGEQFDNNQLDAVKSILVEMKYLLSLQNSIKKRLDELSVSE